MVRGRSVSFLLFFRVTRSAKSDNLSTLHGSSKPGNRSFGRFSRPLLEVYFIGWSALQLKVKSLAVAEIFRYCKGFRLSYSYFCVLDQKYKRGLVKALISGTVAFACSENKRWETVRLAEIFTISAGAILTDKIVHPHIQRVIHIQCMQTPWLIMVYMAMQTTSK